MHVAHVLAARLHVVVDGVGSHGADLHEAVVLDEDGVAREVAVHDGRHAAVQVATNTTYQILNINDLCTRPTRFEH